MLVRLLVLKCILVIAKLPLYIRNTVRLSQGSPSLHIISGELAWSAQQNNYYQYLSVEFPERQNVTKIATQGKQNTREYVTEYILQYSDNADVWITYRDYSGHAKVDGEKHIF